MKLSNMIGSDAANPKKVSRKQWRIAQRAFDRAISAAVTPVQAAIVLDAEFYTRQAVSALAGKTTVQLAYMVCALLAERRIRRRKS